MTSLRVAAVCWMSLTLVACSIGKPIPQPETYAVAPSLPTTAPTAERRPETLRIGSVRVVAAFSGTPLIYRVGDVKFTSDPYHVFIAEPGKMLADQMTTWLDRSGPFRTVTEPESSRTAPYVLEATVTELYGDFRPGQTPAAVLTMRFALIDQTGTRPKAVLERELGRRVDLPGESPDALVRGYGEALAGILTELTGELRTALAK
jgi:cholesterol transport system auxiliary component